MNLYSFIRDFPKEREWVRLWICMNPTPLHSGPRLEVVDGSIGKLLELERSEGILQ